MLLLDFLHFIIIIISLSLSFFLGYFSCSAAFIAFCFFGLYVRLFFICSLTYYPILPFLCTFFTFVLCLFFRGSSYSYFPIRLRLYSFSYVQRLSLFFFVLFPILLCSYRSFSLCSFLPSLFFTFVYLPIFLFYRVYTVSIFLYSLEIEWTE